MSAITNKTMLSLDEQVRYTDMIIAANEALVKALELKMLLLLIDEDFYPRSANSFVKRRLRLVDKHGVGAAKMRQYGTMLDKINELEETNAESVGQVHTRAGLYNRVHNFVHRLSCLH
jgi:hypothetical protein